MHFILRPGFILIFLATLFATNPVSAQQAAIDTFVGHAHKQIEQANRLMQENQVEDAVAALTDANRYIESVINHDLEELLFNVRRENRNFNFNLQISLNSGFSADLWKNKLNKANNALRISQEAIAGLGSIRILDRQDEAITYIKTVYDSVVAIKDVVSSVKTQSYLEAVKSAKEGVDGFIENYKAIEEAKFKKQQTESLEIHINGLVRRANRVINTVEPILSFMKVNAEEAERFEQLLAKARSIKDKVYSGAVQKMVYGDARYTWNYEPFKKELNTLCDKIKAENLTLASVKKEFDKISTEARASWQKVYDNVTASDDEEQKANMLKWANEKWEDFETNCFGKAIDSIKTSETAQNDKSKSPGVNLFAGATSAADSSKIKKQPQKTNPFAGLEKTENTDSETDNAKSQSKAALFAGISDTSADDTPKDQPEQTENTIIKTTTGAKTDKAKEKAPAPIKLGEIYNTGTGDTSTHVGGNYISVLISELSDKDVLEVEVKSGTVKFIHIHLRNSRGIWFSVYNGTNTLFRVGDLLQNIDRNAFTHFNFSINSQHMKHLPIACRANLLRHKGDNLAESVEKKLLSQWRAGSGEIPNDYLQKRPELAYKPGRSQDTSQKSATTTKSSSTIPIKPEQKNVTATPQESRLDLANRVNAIIRRADEDFNKKYWNEKTPAPTSQKASNSKAATLKIMKEAIAVSDKASLPENKIFLNSLIADKLIGYSGRVFDYVGKAEFHAEAAELIRKTGLLIEKTNNDKVTRSFLYSDLGDKWRSLGKISLVGKHAYNKNECYQLEQAAYERALNIYPDNHRAKKALNK